MKSAVDSLVTGVVVTVLVSSALLFIGCIIIATAGLLSYLAVPESIIYLVTGFIGLSLFMAMVDYTA